MSDPVFSPDGKFMWTGTEWVPAPPTAASEPQAPPEQGLNMQDSVIGGDVVHSTVIHNDPAAVTSAVILALREIGAFGEAPAAPPAPPTPEVELPPSFKVGDHVVRHVCRCPSHSRMRTLCVER